MNKKEKAAWLVIGFVGMTTILMFVYIRVSEVLY